MTIVNYAEGESPMESERKPLTYGELMDKIGWQVTQRGPIINPMVIHIADCGDFGDALPAPKPWWKRLLTWMRRAARLLRRKLL